MNKALTLALVLILPIYAWADNSGRDAKINQISAILEKSADTGEFSGSALFTSKNKILFEKSYGFSDRERGVLNSKKTRYLIASISKQYTATSIMLLVRDKKISLDDHLDRFFPLIPEDKKTITIRQLLSHSSGLGDIDELSQQDVNSLDPRVPDPVIAKFLQYPFAVSPGSYYYSNFAFCILARIIENISGKPLETFVHENLLGPAHLNHTTFEGEPVPDGADISYSYGAGMPKTRADQMEYDWFGYKGADGYIQSVREFQKWLHLLFLGHFLTDDERNEMTHPNVLAPYRDIPNNWYAFGWDVVVDPVTSKIKRVYHTGGADYAFASIAGYDLENDYFITVFANQNDETPTSDPLADVITTFAKD
jgi:CubicO group peptidase (beta-lactamase class C family)